MKFLALYLRAPLQSWGAASKFGDRGTLDAPTRSGLLGMITAACGIDKNDEVRDRDWLARAASLSFAVFSFRRGNRMTDYHTVGARYNRDDAWERRMIPTTADGKPRGTDLTHRDYLTDSVFGVVLSGDDGMIAEIASGLADPVWGGWFGRKNCIPTEPILAGVFESDDAAKDAIRDRFCRSLERGKGKVAGSAGESVVFSVVEVTADEAEESVLDVPVSFTRREFHARRVAHVMQEDSQESG